jgi:hypothetical protein
MTKLSASAQRNCTATYTKSTYGLATLLDTAGHCWTQGSVSLTALSYLLHDDPEILFWDLRGGSLTYVTNPREDTSSCTLQDLRHHILARWHISHYSGNFGLFNPDTRQIYLLTERIEQSLRLWHSPLNDSPSFYRQPLCSTSQQHLSLRTRPHLSLLPPTSNNPWRPSNDVHMSIWILGSQRNAMSFNP